MIENYWQQVEITRSFFLILDGTAVARVTRVSTSQNIHVQPSRDLRLENFPSLSLSTPQVAEETALKCGWVKKDLTKGNKSAIAKSISHGQNFLPSMVEEYPVLVSSSLYEPCETGVWITSKNKSLNANGSKIGSSLPNMEVPSEQSKMHSKKKKKPPKLPNKNPVETIVVSSESKNKVSKMQIGELKHHTTGEIPRTIQIGKSKVDLTREANSFESKNIVGSKISIINSQTDPKPVENNGAKPKTKVKPINLSEFPALGSCEPSVSSFFDSSQENTIQMTRVKKVAPTKVTFTSTSGQHFPLTLNNNTNRVFLQPPDFNVRNQQLISTVMDLLCNQRKKIEKFRTISSQFRGGHLDSKEYYMVK